jgi:hypothetical protein
MLSMCAPALIYMVFSLTQIIIDMFNQLYNTAAMKTIVMIMVTILLNALCQNGLTTIAWLIVFIPFIFMTFIMGMLVFVFGLNKKDTKQNGIDTSKGGNMVFYTSVQN